MLFTPAFMKEETDSTQTISATAVWAAIILCLLLVSVVDYETGYEFLFFFFYFAPVSLAAWFLGRSSTFAIACVCGATYWGVDKLSGHYYTHEYYRHWNSFICLLSFVSFGMVLERAKRSLQAQRCMNKELAQKLEELKRSSEKIQQLQENIQIVCAWTKRIKVADKWISLEEFLENELHMKLSHGMSPEAFLAYMKDLERDKKDFS